MVRAKPAKSGKSKRKRRKHAMTKLVESERRTAREANPSNPFEFQTNKKRKRDVFGKKYNAKTNLAAARSAAIDRRKDTLLLEYKNMHKTNSFIDRRIGENDKTLSHEDKMLMRFQAQRAKALRKSQKFSLGDDGDGELLTHMGQSITDDFNFGADARLSESDDDDK